MASQAQGRGFESHPPLIEVFETSPWSGVEPVQLRGFLPAWDVARRRFDAGPIADWVLTAMRGFGVEASSLEQLHRAIDPERAITLSREVTLATARAHRLFHSIIRAALPELPWFALAIQTTAHLRILLPGDAVAPVPPHTDFGIGHWPDERNLWLALTDARGSAALHLADLRTSMALDRERRAAHQVLLPADAPLQAVEAEKGDLLLFTPLHAHGARVVEGDATRVSVDVRIAPRDSIERRRSVAFIPVEPAC